ncbi:LysE family translocator [Actinomadura sp. DC4]|uniref:LysE family translocator n=1 Tax=Actinomadura sp. DC4 TaxID=3055069 RepID=UPI0025B19B02|nr:LysE family translocator [Actinomadura sp. DC4]MDN3351234.1 LysE family translocator [Actinomadura sp. DC4]
MTATLTFTGVAAGLIVAPGVDFAAVARNAIADRRAGVCTGLGVAAGSLVHTAAAVAGVATILVAHRGLFTALQLAGGCYLVYLGVRSLLQREKTAEDPERPPARSSLRAFRQGFVVNASNPKAPVLFLSLLPQFIPPGADPVTRSLQLSLIVVGCALVWFPVVALAVHSVAALLGGWRVQRVLTLVTALLLLALGLRMLLFG